MLKQARSGLKVKYIGEFEGQLKTGAIVTIDEVVITFGTRVRKWFTTVRIKEKDDNGEQIVLFLEALVPKED